jgi:UDPglucose--hexose-1-phosphate uridylyltransferase
MKQTLENLVYYGVYHLGLDYYDAIYARNHLYSLFDMVPEEGIECNKAYVESLSLPDELLSVVYNYALETKMILSAEEDMLTTKVMGYITPAPSIVVNKTKSFSDGNLGLDYLYDLGIKSNYIKKSAIDKNIIWETKEFDPNLVITINLSKPEKDNKEIAKLLANKEKPKYPKCMLCEENLGYLGRVDYPARQTIRYMPVELGGEKWFVQFSPYAYYYKHCIAINQEHKPMVIGSQTIDNILDFVDKFDKYFIGSNAALPIVGGSILNHEHYQGGAYKLPMMYSKAERVYKHSLYPNVVVEELNWYAKSVRLVSEDKEEIARLAKEIIAKWEKYNDFENEIYSHTANTPHNTLSPIACKVDGKYHIYMIFRNNRTNEEHPDGIYHAHKEYHNIKKEGIGLIEAMGLFILPGRLLKETAIVEQYLTGVKLLPVSEEAVEYKHSTMIEKLVNNFGNSNSKDVAKQIVTDEINNVCRNILGNISVFKDENSFAKFANYLGLYL